MVDVKRTDGVHAGWLQRWPWLAWHLDFPELHRKRKKSACRGESSIDFHVTLFPCFYLVWFGACFCTGNKEVLIAWRRRR